MLLYSKDTEAPRNLISTEDQKNPITPPTGELGLPGKFKASIYQHGILLRIFWPLFVYEVPISTVEGFERRISRFLWKWLAWSVSSITLYGQSNKLNQQPE